ncbi:MAG: hypothetical protein K6G04_09770 [Lachnospiraceae bacterium]|nr:hypothetical protein [Lachnospiraceae bacterium]
MKYRFFPANILYDFICDNCYLMKTPYFCYCLDEGYQVTKPFREQEAV